MQITGTEVIQGLAVWDGSAWSAPPGGPVDGFAYELVDDADRLLVGGGFSQIGGIATSAVAAFDGTTWTALDFPDVAVYALARGPDDELYAGGSMATTSRSSRTGSMRRSPGSTRAAPAISWCRAPSPGSASSTRRGSRAGTAPRGARSAPGCPASPLRSRTTPRRSMPARSTRAPGPICSVRST